ncbi:hypothetical protein SLA2020_230270 [Shorea laevis]
MFNSRNSLKVPDPTEFINLSKSGKEMVDVRGKTKVMASSYRQPKRGGLKVKAGIKVGNKDQKIQLGEPMRKLRLQFDDLKNTKEELVEENESLNLRLLLWSRR